MIYVIDVYLSLTNAAGNSQYAFLVQADTKGIAVHRLYKYLDSINFRQENIDRVNIQLLKFDGSNVVEMKQ